MELFLLLALAVPGAAPEGAPLQPPAVAPAPVLPNARAFDLDGDLIDDALAATLPKLGHTAIRVELVFRRPVAQRQLDAFRKAGGSLEWVFQSVSFGFIGRVPADQLRAAVGAVAAAGGREAVLLVKGDDPMRPDLDKATQNARARAAWAPGFAGAALGFNGSPTTTIAFVDTGLDDSHSDLSGRQAYWRDFQGTASSPEDYEGHGSCVASVALGSGAGFEATKPALRFTHSSNFTGIGYGFVAGRTPLRFGTAPVSLSAVGYFDGPNPARLNLSSSIEGSRVYGTTFTTQGPSPLSFTYALTPETNRVYSIGLVQADGGTITWGTTTTSVTPYPVAQDSLPTLRGIAPGCRWASAHASDDVTSVEMALDDLMTQRQTIGLKVLNLSQSPDTDGGTLLPEKISTMVRGGVIVVKTIGNTGRSPTRNVATPSGLTGLALTVGGTNTGNQLTSYTSIGTPTPDYDAGQDLKPDLLAPGGSLIAVDMLCADSNDGDSPDGGVGDQVANDYVPEEGTSFAAPVVAGGAALVIQALESRGLTWSWASADHPRKVKGLLLATATETNIDREREPSGTPSPDPRLGRSAIQKDLAEGYGIINIDAAIEAASLDLTLPITASTSGGQYDRRAWARRVSLVAGTRFAVALGVPPNGDFDLYLYGEGTDPVGNPILLAASDRAGVGLVERVSYVPTVTETGVLVVKRISGSGAFQLVTAPTCGNGIKEVTEECDDGNTVDRDCCSFLCLAEPNGGTCPAGTCLAGVCEVPVCGNGVISNPETCDDGNRFDGDCCSASCQREPEGASCNGGSGACTAGVCVPPKKLPGVNEGVATHQAAACSCGTTDGVLALSSLAALWGLRRRRSLPRLPPTSRGT